MSVCGYLGAGYCTTANGNTPWNYVATCQDSLADCEAQVSSTTACMSWAAVPTKIEQHSTVTTQARKCKSKGQGRCMVFDATDGSPGANKAAAGAGLISTSSAHLAELGTSTRADGARGAARGMSRAAGTGEHVRLVGGAVEPVGEFIMGGQITKENMLSPSMHLRG